MHFLSCPADFGRLWRGFAATCPVARDAPLPARMARDAPLPARGARDAPLLARDSLAPVRATCPVARGGVALLPILPQVLERS